MCSNSRHILDFLLRFTNRVRKSVTSRTSKRGYDCFPMQYVLQIREGCGSMSEECGSWLSTIARRPRYECSSLFVLYRPTPRKMIITLESMQRSNQLHESNMHLTPIFPCLIELTRSMPFSSCMHNTWSSIQKES